MALGAQERGKDSYDVIGVQKTRQKGDHIFEQPGMPEFGAKGKKGKRRGENSIFLRKKKRSKSPSGPLTPQDRVRGEIKP